jgi:hypothetical protein
MMHQHWPARIAMGIQEQMIESAKITLVKGDLIVSKKTESCGNEKH